MGANLARRQTSRDHTAKRHLHLNDRHWPMLFSAENNHPRINARRLRLSFSRDQKWCGIATGQQSQILSLVDDWCATIRRPAFERFILLLRRRSPHLRRSKLPSNGSLGIKLTFCAVTRWRRVSCIWRKHCSCGDCVDCCRVAARTDNASGEVYKTQDKRNVRFTAAACERFARFICSTFNYGQYTFAVRVTSVQRIQAG
jgi:hypothetical protein